MTLETAKELLAKYHQEHVLQYYDTLSDTEKAALLEQIEETDFSVTEQITAGKCEQACIIFQCFFISITFTFSI